MGSQGSDGCRELPTDGGKGAEAAIIHSSGAGWEHGLLCQGHNEQRERCALCSACPSCSEIFFFSVKLRVLVFVLAVPGEGLVFFYFKLLENFLWVRDPDTSFKAVANSGFSV